MFDLLVKKYIKNYKDIDNNDIREKYGILCSILSIICNLIMSIFKLIFGFVTSSVAISADGLNNLSDMGSNLATLFGFKLANKHPDASHPYGHGRIEYIAGMVISFLILFVGFNSLKEAIIKIVYQDSINFSFPAMIVLILSIIMKLWMASFNKKTGKLLNSSSLLAASRDSLNDVLVTSATLLSLLLSLFNNEFPIDGLIACLVSLIVLKSGIEIFKDTMNPLLGMAPDKKLVSEIIEYVMSFDIVIGIHDLMMHDYGPSRQYMTLHVEVNSKADICNVHDEIDIIEREILKRFNILTTIHMDPIDCDDEKTNKLKEIVLKIVKDIDDGYNIHDFRIVSGISHTNLIFDVLIPSEDIRDHEEIKELIESRVKKVDNTYYCVIEVEHSYV